MVNLDFKKQIVVFGVPVTDALGPVMVNEALANLLIQLSSGNAVKMMSLCIRLHDSGKLELEESDFEFFKRGVRKAEERELGADMLLAQVWEIINSAENVGKS
jgi:hypothetical protein